jgi:glyoxylase-like metal-dependent hydrolase (beta-lactamase superfamily II)
LATLFLVALVVAQVAQPDGAGVRPGRLPVQWLVGGPRCMEVEEFRTHEYNEDFYIIRQSGCSHYEKPFLYLLFGRDRAILFDTGAGQPQTARHVLELRDRWLRRKGRASIPLIVAHTHGHSDHTAGDAGFQNLPGVTFVPGTVEGQKQFFGLTQWPEQFVTYDLGNRVLDIFPIPGHEPAAIAIYDRETGVFLSGDNLYPGRLYVFDDAAFIASAERMARFAEGKVIAHVLGCHIENTNTPYLEYPIGSLYQPDEARLDMTRGHILELQAAVRKFPNGKLQRVAYRDFTIWPMPPEVLKNMRDWRKLTEEKQRLTQWDQPPGPAARVPEPK